MGRDNFSKPTIDRMAKRVGMRCSNPNCRKPTAGPDSADGVLNLGVAAHIRAASPGGPRFDDQQSSEERASIENGIWLCQNDAKLIDDDELAFPVRLLQDWKDTAEKMAALEAQGFVIQPGNKFVQLEKKLPSLIEEMRSDLSAQPLTREFIVMSKKWVYNGGSKPYFAYYYEDHPEIEAMLTIMEHYSAVYDVRFNDVVRYNFNEDFVEYLVG